jgi:hypothetical protein
MRKVLPRLVIDENMNYMFNEFKNDCFYTFYWFINMYKLMELVAIEFIVILQTYCVVIQLTQYF